MVTLRFNPRLRQRTLFQFINVLNFRLVEPLLHLSSISVVNRVQIWTFGSHRSSEMKAGVSHTRRLNISLARCRSTVLLEDKELDKDLTHDSQ